MGLYVKKLNAQIPRGAGQCDPEKGVDLLSPFYLVAYYLHRASQCSSCDCVFGAEHPLSPPPGLATAYPNRPQLGRLAFLFL